MDMIDVLSDKLEKNILAAVLLGIFYAKSSFFNNFSEILGWPMIAILFFIIIVTFVINRNFIYSIFLGENGIASIVIFVLPIILIFCYFSKDVLILLNIIIGFMIFVITHFCISFFCEEIEATKSEIIKLESSAGNKSKIDIENLDKLKKDIKILNNVKYILMGIIFSVIVWLILYIAIIFIKEDKISDNIYLLYSFVILISNFNKKS